MTQLADGYIEHEGWNYDLIKVSVETFILSDSVY